MKQIVLLILIMVSHRMCAQEKRADIDSIITTHVAEFRKTMVNDDAVILVDFVYNYPDSIALHKNDLIIEGRIGALKLKKRVDYYLVKFLLVNDQGKLTLHGINFRVEKAGRKRINLINLLNGQEYAL